MSANLASGRSLSVMHLRMACSMSSACVQHVSDALLVVDGCESAGERVPDGTVPSCKSEPISVSEGFIGDEPKRENGCSEAGCLKLVNRVQSSELLRVNWWGFEPIEIPDDFWVWSAAVCVVSMCTRGLKREDTIFSAANILATSGEL